MIKSLIIVFIVCLLIRASIPFLENVYLSLLDTLDRDPQSKSLNRKHSVLNLCTDKQCKQIIEDSETFALKYKWMNKRHDHYATTDNLMDDSWPCYKTLEKSVKEVLIPSLGDMYGIDPNKVDIKEIFVARYDADGQRKLDAHRDGGEFSFILALNDSYTGGGTQFSETGEKVKLNIGQCVLFSGQNEHKGLEITTGTRYIVAGFLNYKGEDYCDKMDLYQMFDSAGDHNDTYISQKSKAGDFIKRKATHKTGGWRDFFITCERL